MGARCDGLLRRQRRRAVRGAASRWLSHCPPTRRPPRRCRSTLKRCRRPDRRRRRTVPRQSSTRHRRVDRRRVLGLHPDLCRSTLPARRGRRPAPRGRRRRARLPRYHQGATEIPHRATRCLKSRMARHFRPERHRRTRRHVAAAAFTSGPAQDLFERFDWLSLDSTG